MACKVHAGVPAQQIIEQHQEQWLQSFMGQHGLTDRAVARALLVASKPPRDYYLSKADVQNIERTVQETTWRRHPDQQCSLSLFAEAIGEDVLVHQLQEPVKGTPDAEFMAARSRAAAERAAAEQSQAQAGTSSARPHRPPTGPFYNEQALAQRPDGAAEEEGAPLLAAAAACPGAATGSDHAACAASLAPSLGHGNPV